MLTANPHQSVAAWIAALAKIVSGALLLAGFMTPIAAAAVLAGAMAMAFTSHLDSPLSPALIVVLAAALILVGPGALSFDARLFGRREIIIPRSTRLPKF
jgi:uncharacterized membrane protein YphA (DoxX/SURF4 family)